MAPAAARSMLAIMRGVTEQGGTAKQAAIEGYAVAGKTGTAQKVANGHYDPEQMGVVVRRRRAGGGSAPGDHGRSSTSRRAATWAARWRRRSSRRSPSRRCAICTCRRRTAIAAKTPTPKGRPATGRRRDGGEAGAAADADDGADRGARHRACRSTTTRWATIRRWRRRGTRSPAPRADVGERPPRRAGRGSRLRGAEPRAGDSRRAQERRRAGVRRPEGRATGVALRQRPAPGPAPRGVVCRVAFGRQRMTTSAPHAAPACWRASTARASYGDADVADQRGARRFAAGGTGRSVRRGAGHGGRRAPVPRRRRRARRRGAGRRGRAAGRGSAFPGPVVVVPSARRALGVIAPTASARRWRLDAVGRDRHQRQDDDDVHRRGDAARRRAYAGRGRNRHVPGAGRAGRREPAPLHDARAR